MISDGAYERARAAWTAAAAERMAIPLEEFRRLSDDRKARMTREERAAYEVELYIGVQVALRGSVDKNEAVRVFTSWYLYGHAPADREAEFSEVDLPTMDMGSDR